MNRDEILERSRRENQGGDEYERDIALKSAKLGMKIGLLACCIVATVSVAVTERINDGCWIIYFSILATDLGNKYRHLRRRDDLARAIASAAVCLMFAVRFVRGLMGA